MCRTALDTSCSSTPTSSLTGRDADARHSYSPTDTQSAGQHQQHLLNAVESQRDDPDSLIAAAVDRAGHQDTDKLHHSVDEMARLRSSDTNGTSHSFTVMTRLRPSVARDEHVCCLPPASRRHGDETQSSLSDATDRQLVVVDDVEDCVTASHGDVEDCVTTCHDDMDDRVTRSRDDIKDCVTTCHDDAEGCVTISCGDFKDCVTTRRRDDMDDCGRTGRDDFKDCVTRSCDDIDDCVTTSHDDFKDCVAQSRDDTDDCVRTGHDDFKVLVTASHDDVEDCVTTCHGAGTAGLLTGPEGITMLMDSESQLMQSVNADRQTSVMPYVPVINNFALPAFVASLSDSYSQHACPALCDVNEQLVSSESRVTGCHCDVAGCSHCQRLSDITRSPSASAADTGEYCKYVMLPAADSSASETHCHTHDEHEPDINNN